MLVTIAVSFLDSIFESAENIRPTSSPSSALGTTRCMKVRVGLIAEDADAETLHEAEESEYKSEDKSACWTERYGGYCDWNDV